MKEYDKSIKEIREQAVQERIAKIDNPMFSRQTQLDARRSMRRVTKSGKPRG